MKQIVNTKIFDQKTIILTLAQSYSFYCLVGWTGSLVYCEATRVSNMKIDNWSLRASWNLSIPALDSDATYGGICLFVIK